MNLFGPKQTESPSLANRSLIKQRQEKIHAESWTQRDVLKLMIVSDTLGLDRTLNSYLTVNQFIAYYLWSSEELTNAPLWKTDVLIVDKGIWSELRSMKSLFEWLQVIPLVLVYCQDKTEDDLSPNLKIRHASDVREIIKSLKQANQVKMKTAGVMEEIRP